MNKDKGTFIMKRYKMLKNVKSYEILIIIIKRNCHNSMVNITRKKKDILIVIN